MTLGIVIDMLVCPAGHRGGGIASWLTRITLPKAQARSQEGRQTRDDGLSPVRIVVSAGASNCTTKSSRSRICRVCEEEPGARAGGFSAQEGAVNLSGIESHEQGLAGEIRDRRTAHGCPRQCRWLESWPSPEHRLYDVVTFIAKELEKLEDEEIAATKSI